MEANTGTLKNRELIRAMYLRKDNAMVICHALTGSSDVEDWYACVSSSPTPELTTSA